MIRSILLIIWLGLAAFISPVLAAELTQEQVQSVEQLDERASALSEKVETVKTSDEQLVELAIEADSLEQELLAKGVELAPRLGEIRTRLEQLGDPPKEGDPAEAEFITAEREDLFAERADINQLLGILEDQSILTKVTLDRISEARRELFTGSLSRRYNITDAFSAELFGDVADRITSLNSRVNSWWSFTWRFKSDAMLGAIGAILALILGILWAGRRTFFNWIARDPKAHEPTYFQRLTTAFWYTILPSLMLWAFLAASFGILNFFNLLRDDIADILQTVLILIAAIFLVWRLAEAIVAPKLPNWRLLDISNQAARPLKFFIIMMVVVATGDVLVTNINVIVGTSVPITIAKSLMTSIAVGVLLILIAFLRPFLNVTGIVTEGGRPWPLFFKVTLVSAGTILILSALAGYIGFARFVAQQIVVTGALIATMHLGYRASQAIAEERALHQTALGSRLMNDMQISERGLDQIGLITGIFMTVLVLTIGLPVLALLWGFQWLEVRAFVVQFFTDIQIGSISISITSILIGIALFAVGLFVTKRFQTWLDGSVMVRSGVGDGARNSIRTAVGYVGVAIAGLFGVSAAGFELSQLALVAGALSLGIGFGLQNVVSNFVSGLILLAERPFKSGDIIEAGGFTGIVKNIKVRATEIETFDKKTLVLPNSELINSSVINWVHKTTLGRVEVAVGVSYDSDPQQVYDLLLEIANDHPRILGNPEPFVEFANFGDSSLDFVLRGFLADIGFGLAVRTELRLAIFERFKVAGIEIPFPQRDVNLRMVNGKIDKITENIDPDGFDVIKTGKKRTMEEDGD